MPVASGESFRERVSPVIGGVRYSIPDPRLSDSERLRRRLAFRNQLYVYPRESAFSGSKLISMFAPDQTPSVVTSDEWFGDSWDGTAFARELNFSRPFFPQIAELRSSIPHLARSAFFNESSDYCNNLSNCRRTYLIFNSVDVEDTMYGENLLRVRDSLDCSYLTDCELCYDCLLCENCYQIQSCWDCEHCSDSFFLLGCRNCSDCFGCTNLRRKEFHLFNQPVSRKEYASFLAGIDLSSRKTREEMTARVQELWRAAPRPHAMIRDVEGESSGNYLYHSKDLANCYFVQNGESLRNCAFMLKGAKDCQDFTFVGLNSELMYECGWCALDSQLCRFCWWCLQSSDLLYCMHCVGCRSCFGCVGLQKKQFCIFNRQYSEAEYLVLVPKFIAHMQATTEWGEFFPIEHSPIPYNHSMAQRFFPLDRPMAEAEGVHWYDKPLVSSASALPVSATPDQLPESDDTLVLTSVLSGAAFRVTAEELKRMRQFRCPLPSLAYDERLQLRAKRLGGLELSDRACARTGKRVETNVLESGSSVVWDRATYESEFSA